VNGPATTAEWLACGGFGTGVGAALLWGLKCALDLDADLLPDVQAHRFPSIPAPPALPAHAPQRRPRHAAPLIAVETQPIRCMQPDRARHAKKAA
jgi:hypothetical protein